VTLLSDLGVKPFRILHNGKQGFELFLETLREQTESLTDNQIKAIIDEIEVLKVVGTNTPKQEDWIDWMLYVLRDELDARWLIRRLQERGVVTLERA
jgi:hypothetical protein